MAPTKAKDIEEPWCDIRKVDPVTLQRGHQHRQMERITLLIRGAPKYTKRRPV